MFHLLPKYLENRVERILSNIGTLPLGTDQTWTVPAGKIWVPLLIFGRFTASAVVANRGIQVIFSSGGVEFGRIRANTIITASLIARYTFARGLGDQPSIGNTAINSLPDFTLGPGDTIQLTASAIDAGDQFTFVTLLYNEYDL